MQRPTFAYQLRPTVADELLCPKCGTVPSAQREGFAAWVKADRPDLSYLVASIICRCEKAECEHNERMARNMRDANLPLRNDKVGPRTFKNLDPKRWDKEQAQEVATWAEGKDPASLSLIGATGSGKTHLIEAVLRRSLALGETARYERAGDLLDRLRHTFTDPDADLYSLLDWYDSLDILAIDDLGAQTSTPWAVGQLTTIIDKRYADGRPLIVGTNLGGVDEIAEHWGDRIASRLFDTQTGAAQVVWCKAKDYRRAK